MEKLLIAGGRPLEGKIVIGGAKNAALPAMAAALLTNEMVILENVPRVRDISTLRLLLEELGVDSSFEHDTKGNRLTIQARKLRQPRAPYELVKTMRASVLVLGPLVARFRRAEVSLPGGCTIGERPINLHLKGLRKLGATTRIVHGYVQACAKRLRGARFRFEGISVTGTENLMMAAVLAEGETVLENAACEPEVTDLADLLTAMGAKISGAGTETVRIKGVTRLRGARHRIIPDRIEAGTYLAAAGITRGHLILQRCRPDHMRAIIEKFRETGMEIKIRGRTSLEVRGPRRLQASDLTTREYPGFATDMQAQYMALATQAEGTSVITETIFEKRFMHALEMSRMGADVTLEGRNAIVRGPKPLSGAKVLASDLRASASLVLAGLAARGETLIDRVYHIDRGYERIEEKLSQVGAKIRRVSTSPA